MTAAADPRKYLDLIRQAFFAQQNPEKASAQRAYMKDQFEFIGMPAADIRNTLKEIRAAHGEPKLEILPDLIRALWACPEREFHHAAIELMVRQKRKLPQSFIALVEECITIHSWWDTVDGLSIWVMGPLLTRFPEKREALSQKWVKSPDMWLQRCAIIFQNHYKEATDLDLLFRNCKACADSSEWFIQKAIGWALRTAGAKFPEEVIQFCKETPLAPFSKKEALRKLI